MVMTTIDQRTWAKGMAKGKFLLMPYKDYLALLRKIEELEDMRDMLQAEIDYRKGQGRPFREFLKEHQDAFGLPR
jgi:hypothetical protein